MKIAGIGIIVLVSALGVGFFFANTYAAEVCHTLPDSAFIPDGYSSAYALADGSYDLLISVLCDPTSATVTVGNNSSLTYIYESGYELDGTSWDSINFTGSVKRGNWFVGRASATRSRTMSEMSEENYILAYTCIWADDEWKCGCREEACTEQFWHVQQFTLDSGNGGNGGGGTTVSIPDIEEDLEVLLEDLDTPWDMTFLPDQTLLIAERPGRVVHLAGDGSTIVTPLDDVDENAEAGVHGITLHPDFEDNNWVYIYSFQEGASNRVARYTYDDRRLTFDRTIISGIPGATYHNGGGLRFGPDDKLYISTGDAANEDLAQDLDSLAGKVLRLNDDGSVPSDNPFNNAVWSYGHRNPQGLVFVNGRLWATEHGPSGGGDGTGQDEINLIEKGKNYGWPTIRGDETQGGLESPKLHSTSDVTWAPSSLTYWDGSLFFTGLRGSSIYEADINGSNVTNLTRHFQDDYGRLRAIIVGPDGAIYFSTSNRDQTNSPRTGDDKVIRIKPDVWFR